MSNSGESTAKQVNYNNNPTGKGGFRDHPEHRNNGAWRKERTPRGRLEKLINDVSYDELLELIAELKSGKIKKDRKVGEVLDVGLLKDAIEIDPDKDDVNVSHKRLLEVYDFVYGRKDTTDSNLKIDTEESSPLIRGFVLPIAPDSFINNNGKQAEQ